jgi:hypothetical protein
MLSHFSSAGFSVLTFVLTLSALGNVTGCAADAGRTEEASTLETGQSVVVLGKISPYLQDRCWSATSPVTLVQCDSGTPYSLDDADGSGYFRFYVGNMCLTVAAGPQIMLEPCADPFRDPTMDQAQRWKVTYQSGAGVDTVYQVQNKLDNGCLKANGADLLSYPHCDTGDHTQLWQHAKYF